MEGLLNYSSEDEQDDGNCQTVAVRGSPSSAEGSSSNEGRADRGPTANNSNMKGGNSRGGGSGGTTSSSVRSSSRDEDFTKARQSSSSGAGSRSNATSSSYYRDNRESREMRQSPRDFRYSKDYGNGRHDYKSNERSRPKSDHRRERDSYRDDKRYPRDEDHNGSRYSSSTSSTHYKGRYNSGARDDRNRYSSDYPAHRHQYHHNRSHDDRNERDNYGRVERSSGRHRRRSDSRSPSPQQNYNTKRTVGRNDKHHYTRRTSRSRSRSPARAMGNDYDTTESQPLQQARLSALEMERKIHEDDQSGQRKSPHQQQSQHNQHQDGHQPQLPARGSEALLALPLSDTAPKQPNVIAVAPSTSSNNSEPAVIQLPSYYNPSVINPNKYAEQVQKRKLLWGAKKSEDTAAKWGNAQFSQDTDGKVASKFMRLMGIKGAAPAATVATGAASPTMLNVVEQKPSVAPDMKSREAMFSNMEQQYEVARQATHTMRGVGLGFSSQSRPF